MENKAFEMDLFPIFTHKSREFMDLLTRETDLLQKYDLDAALELLPLKQTYATEHQQIFRQIMEPDFLAQMSPPQLALLKELANELKDTLTRNEEALRIVHTVQEGIFHEITNSIKGIEAPVCQYAKNKRQVVNTTPFSMSLINQKI